MYTKPLGGKVMGIFRKVNKRPHNGDHALEKISLL
jgi:hypothetical protein